MGIYEISFYDKNANQPKNDTGLFLISLRSLNATRIPLEDIIELFFNFF